MMGAAITSYPAAIAACPVSHRGVSRTHHGVCRAHHHVIPRKGCVAHDHVMRQGNPKLT